MAKCANPPHTGDSKSCQYGDKAPLKPHISRVGGGGGVGVYFDWCISKFISVLLLSLLHYSKKKVFSVISYCE